MIRFSLPLRAAVFAVALSSPAHAVVLAGWDFETNTPSLTSGTTSTVVAAETGSGSFHGVHASSATTWTPGAGNGSPSAYLSNNWTTGDYYEFSTSSTGYEGITISFDQVGTGQGPRDFQFSYSIDGTNFTNFGSVYATQRTGPLGIDWEDGTSLASFSYDLNSLSELDDAATIYFRISQVGVASVAPGLNVTATGGSRLDNVVINGTAVPEPAAALLCFAGFLGFLRRRR